MSIDGKHAYRFGYLKSEAWRGVRLEALSAAGAKCEICGVVDWHNDAHHTTYPENIWKTERSHLAVLCRRCNDAVHDVMSEHDHGEKWRVIKSAVKGLLSSNRECVICHTTEGVEAVYEDRRCVLYSCLVCGNKIVDALEKLKPKTIWGVLERLSRDWINRELDRMRSRP